MQKTVFKTQKMDRTFQILYFGLMIFLLGIAIFTSIVEKDPMAFYVMGGLVLFLGLVISSSFFNMKIVIENGELKIINFFNWYKTDVSQITKIRKGETMWSGLHKYGTATKGLIIFARYKNDLYITPENEELFYQKILEQNPDVIIEKV